MKTSQVQLIPVPKRVKGTGETATLMNFIFTNHENWKKYLSTFTESFLKMNEVGFEIGEGGIRLEYDCTVKKGGYRFMACESGVTLSASDDEGILYALATALQLIEVKEGKLTVPEIEIEDYTDKQYRALMVDLVSCPHPAWTMYKYIDICFLFKINYLHVHFIDNLAYALPSKAFPDMPTKGRSYTFDEIRSINEYARSRGVVIIPEFEAPGHAKSLNDAYPEIFANKVSDHMEGAFTTETGALVTSKNLICAGSEETMNAVSILLEEICEMFPDTPYIHIGGDEANIKAWNNCTVCTEYMKKNNIDDVYELYSDFVGRVAKKVLALGKTPIVWEGFPKKGAERVPKETVVIAWESHYHMAYDLLDEGFKVLNSSWQPLYIVPGQAQRWSPFDIMNWNVYNWQHWWENSQAYLNPINVEPTENVLGGQLSSWGCTYEQEINLIMENLSALSERVWNVERVCNDREFLEKHTRLMIKAASLIAARA